MRGAAGVAWVLMALVAACAGQAIVPPKGWNSWDTFQGNLNETELMGIAQKMVDLGLLAAGYDTLTIDEFWYPNNAGSRSDVDQFGRAIIDTTKWPSAAGGKGFKPLADRLHAMGFKLGIHVMHGVPVGALASPPPTVKGTQIPVPSIKSDELCPWNKNWYKVDMTRPGAQDYYNSIYAQYAAWEIDFIKNDCVFGDNFSPVTQKNIEAARAAMAASKRAFVYSLSPGFDSQFSAAEALADASAIQPYVNLYRITSDWHGWNGSDGEPGWPNHFRLANTMQSLIAAESKLGFGRSWPDLDMLNPFDDRESMVQQQILWSIARSPLIYGGDPRTLTRDSDHVKIMANPALLAVSDHSSNNSQVYRTASACVWRANAASSGSVYAALFALDGRDTTVSVSFAQLGLRGSSAAAKDLVTGAESSITDGTLSATLSACSRHSTSRCAAMFLLTPS